MIASPDLLAVQDLVKSFSGRVVVNHVSFSVGRGEIVGLLGRNGAGKTSSFRMVVGMLVPNAGAVHFAGENVTALPMYKRAQRGMSYLSQEPSVFQRLTVEQNLLAILETFKGSTTAERKKTCRRVDGTVRSDPSA
jgi:lipopolysaccharide export system ATP-binding protein